MTATVAEWRERIQARMRVATEQRHIAMDVAEWMRNNKPSAGQMFWRFRLLPEDMQRLINGLDSKPALEIVDAIRCDGCGEISLSLEGEIAEYWHPGNPEHQQRHLMCAEPYGWELA